MNRKPFLILCLFAVLAANSFGQTNNFQASTKLTSGNEGADPLRLFDDDDDEKASGVKASVIVNMAAAERGAFEMINKKRVENGQTPLTWSDELAAVARVHSQNMAEFNFFSHRGLDNKMVSDRADDQKLGRWRAIGENIAFNRGYDDPTAKAVALWLDSATHRRNLLSPDWKESAIGVAVTENGAYYFTQVFLVRK